MCVCQQDALVNVVAASCFMRLFLVVVDSSDVCMSTGRTGVCCCI